MAKYEKICKDQGRNLYVITQNVDGLHKRAGTENILELHGSLDKIICTKCRHIDVNVDNPICEALRGRGFVRGCWSVARIGHFTPCYYSSNYYKIKSYFFGISLGDVLRKNTQ